MSRHLDRRQETTRYGLLRGSLFMWPRGPFSSCRYQSPGARPSLDPAAVDGTATPWARPVPPTARWDVALRLSVSSVIHDRPSTPRSSFGTVRGLKRHVQLRRERRLRQSESPTIGSHQAHGCRPPCRLATSDQLSRSTGRALRSLCRSPTACRQVSRQRSRAFRANGLVGAFEAEGLELQDICQ